MKNKDFPLRRKCLLLAGKDIKALYCHYKYHNSLLLLLLCFIPPPEMVLLWVYLKNGLVSPVSAFVLYTDACVDGKNLKVNLNAHVVNVIQGGPIDILKNRDARL